jgi:RNase P subunit RPR2
MSNTVPSTRCPGCRAPLDRALSSEFNNRKPRPYDISVCVMCGTVLEFDKRLVLRAASRRTINSLPLATRSALLTAKERIMRMHGELDKNVTD